MAAPAPSCWQAAFVVTTVALGDTLVDARSALAPDDWAQADAVVPGLGHTDRIVRARTLATGLGLITADIETARLA